MSFSPWEQRNVPIDGQCMRMLFCNWITSQQTKWVPGHGISRTCPRCYKSCSTRESDTGNSHECDHAPERQGLTGFLSWFAAWPDFCAAGLNFRFFWDQGLAIFQDELDGISAFLAIAWHKSWNCRFGAVKILLASPHPKSSSIWETGCQRRMWHIRPRQTAIKKDRWTYSIEPFDQRRHKSFATALFNTMINASQTGSVVGNLETVFLQLTTEDCERSAPKRKKTVDWSFAELLFAATSSLHCDKSWCSRCQWLSSMDPSAKSLRRTTWRAVKRIKKSDATTQRQCVIHTALAPTIQALPSSQNPRILETSACHWTQMLPIER